MSEQALKAGIKIYGGVPGVLSSVSFTYEVSAAVVTFTDTSTENPHAWFWDFGDEVTSTEQHPIHDYVVSGNYAVVLTVTAGNGSSASAPVMVVVA